MLGTLAVAGCHGGGSHAASNPPGSTAPAKVAAPTPPSDHGGYFGAEAKAYDSAFIECYKAAVAIRDPEPNSNSLSFVGSGQAIDWQPFAAVGTARIRGRPLRRPRPAFPQPSSHRRRRSLSAIRQRLIPPANEARVLEG
jgi:hypothetical protein